MGRGEGRGWWTVVVGNSTPCRPPCLVVVGRRTRVNPTPCSHRRHRSRRRPFVALLSVVLDVRRLPHNPLPPWTPTSSTTAASAQMMHQPPAPIQVPALYLYPLNDSFIPKHIHLPPGQHVKIGRQTNAKTTPGERNGFFDSKVLSRQHAEVWAEKGKVSPLCSA